MTPDQPLKSDKKGLAGWRLNLLRGAALALVIGLSLAMYLNRERVRELYALGYPGIFLVALISNATIVLPVPGVLVTGMMGAVFNPFWVALAASAGAALGELSGYLAGFGGQIVAERSAAYERIEGWMKKSGQWAILVLALIPNPFFDFAGIAAGALKMPLGRFLFFCWLGQLGKMLFFAYGGAALLPFLGGK